VSRVDCVLAEPTKLLDWSVGDANVKLRHFCRDGIAGVGDDGGDCGNDVEEAWVATRLKGTIGRKCSEIGGGVAEIGGEGRVVESGVCQAEAEGEASSDVLRFEGAIVDVDALGVVALSEAHGSVVRTSGIEESTIIRCILGGSVRHASGERLLSVHESGQSWSSHLAYRFGLAIVRVGYGLGFVRKYPGGEHKRWR